MDQFDGLISYNSTDYVPRHQGDRRRRQYIIGGASVFALFVLILLTTSSGGKNQSSKSEPYDTVGTPSAVDTPKGMYTFNPRHPPAGVYDDEISLKIVEDMSSLAKGLLGNSFEVDLVMDSVKTMKDVDNNQQSVNLHVTRMATHMDAGAIVVDCDTSKEAKGKDKIFCAQNKDVLGKDLEYVIDEDGEIVSQGHDVKVMDSRLAKNPVEHVTSKLKFLPNEPVKKGDMWQSRVVLGDIGDFVGTTTFKGFVECPDGSKKCARFVSTGSAYLDAREAASSLRESLGDNSMDDITITESTMELDMHWDEAIGVIVFSKTLMQFKINMDPVLGSEKVSIPVSEEIVMKSSRH